MLGMYINRDHAGLTFGWIIYVMVSCSESQLDVVVKCGGLSTGTIRWAICSSVVAFTIFKMHDQTAPPLSHSPVPPFSPLFKRLDTGEKSNPYGYNPFHPAFPDVWTLRTCNLHLIPHSMYSPFDSGFRNCLGCVFLLSVAWKHYVNLPPILILLKKTLFTTQDIFFH